MFMSLALTAIPFLASFLGAGGGVFISTALLCILGLIVGTGLFNNVPRRNALGIIPALSISASFLYYYWNGSFSNFPWAMVLLTVWFVSGVIFTYLALAKRCR
jgi:hypothetical protein